MGCAKRAAGNPKRGIDPKNHLLVFRLVRLPTANPRPQIHHQRVEANKKIDPTNTNTTFNALLDSLCPPLYSTPLIAQMSPPCGRKRSNITHLPSGDQTAVDRDVCRHKGVLTDALDIVAHALCIVLNGEPLDVVAGTFLREHRAEPLRDNVLWLL